MPIPQTPSNGYGLPLTLQTPPAGSVAAIFIDAGVPKAVAGDGTVYVLGAGGVPPTLQSALFVGAGVSLFVVPLNVTEIIVAQASGAGGGGCGAGVGPEVSGGGEAGDAAEKAHLR